MRTLFSFYLFPHSRAYIVALLVLFSSCSESAHMEESKARESSTKADETQMVDDISSKILAIDYFKTNSFYINRSWNVAGAINHHMKASGSNFTYVEVQTKDRQIVGFGAELHDLSRTDEAIALVIAILGDDINYLSIKAYLERNLRQVVSSIDQADPYEYSAAVIKAGNIAFTFGAQKYNSYIVSVAPKEPVSI